MVEHDADGNIVYPAAPEGARLRACVWTGFEGVKPVTGEPTGERFGITRVFADKNGKANFLWEGDILNVKDPALEADFRAACRHYGITTSSKPMNLASSRGCS